MVESKFPCKFPDRNQAALNSQTDCSSLRPDPFKTPTNEMYNQSYAVVKQIYDDVRSNSISCAVHLQLSSLVLTTENRSLRPQCCRPACHRQPLHHQQVVEFQHHSRQGGGHPVVSLNQHTAHYPATTPQSIVAQGHNAADHALALAHALMDQLYQLNVSGAWSWSGIMRPIISYGHTVTRQRPSSSHPRGV